jgi:F420-non-reducing hydrogenase large subunit
VTFYDGRVRVVDPAGGLHGEYAPADYGEWIAERVEPWTYLKFPYLRKVGWAGFVDGAASGAYSATPLARLNVADGMATPLAQEAFERFFATLAPATDGRRRPVHGRMAMHWARLVELLFAAERMVELVNDPEITSDRVRTPVGAVVGEGVGTVEAPRGTLTHHYRTDERGVITWLNLIVGTTNNYAPITMSVDRAARALIHGGEAGQGLLNRIEMAFRAYDPCFGCATHSLPGQMPLLVTIRSADGEVIDVRRQHC